MITHAVIIKLTLATFGHNHNKVTSSTDRWHGKMMGVVKGLSQNLGACAYCKSKAVSKSAIRHLSHPMVKHPLQSKRGQSTDIILMICIGSAMALQPL